MKTVIAACLITMVCLTWGLSSLVQALIGPTDTGPTYRVSKSGAAMLSSTASPANQDTYVPGNR
jgi:hypothetical protein